jgi:signal transduction histidine kinase
VELISQALYTETYRLKRSQEASWRLLKVLRANADSLLWQKHFNHEYQISQQLSLVAECPVRLALEKTHWEGRPALLLEYLPGLSLREFLTHAARLPLDLNSALKIAQNLAQALADLHQQGVAHLGLCPEHVLLQPESLKVTLISLGQAQRLNTDSSAEGRDSEIWCDPRYQSPEQTKRMGFWVDQRSDLYSLGVLLYELFTGDLPFVMQDPLELSYAHQVLTPPDPQEFFPATLEGQETLASILTTLLAKDPADRYQSAESLLYDLRLCGQEYQQSQRFPQLEPAFWDRQARFELSEEIFGREPELALLNAVIAGRAEQKQARMLLISGPSGYGKSRLLQEALKQTRCAQADDFKTCLLQGGKFEQQSSPVPYQALIFSLNQWSRQILLSEPEQLEIWKTRFQTEFQESPLPLLELVPQLAFLFERASLPSASVPLETPQARKAHLKIAVLHFFQFLLRFQGPLIITLEDLHWADAASLEWLYWLLNAEALPEILILATARDSEATQTVFYAWLEEQAKTSRAGVEHLLLPPLQADAVQSWLTRSLLAELLHPQSLVSQVMHFSQGNAFEVRQYLLQLAATGGLVFKREQQHWEWTLETMGPQADPRDFIQTRLVQLEPEIQDLLYWAAISGRRLNLAEWAQISGLKPEKVWQYALNLQKLGWIEMQGQRFHFQHDRIQQHILQSLSEKQQAQRHLKLGLLLLSVCTEQKKCLDSPDLALIHEILFHLNQVAAQVPLESQRLNLARLNALAAQAARQNSAFEVSLNFATHGLTLLPEEAWTEQYELCFELYLRLAEAQTVLSDLEAAHRHFSLLWKQARSTDNKLLVSALQMNYYTQKNQHELGLRVFEERINEAGMPLPKQKLKFWGQIAAGLWRLRRLVQERSLAELKALPQIQTSSALLQAQLMADVIQILQEREDIPYILWLQVHMALIGFEKGFFPMSPVNFAVLSHLFLLQFKDQVSAEKLMALARYLSQTFADPLVQAKMQTALALFTEPYLSPLPEVSQDLQRAAETFQNQGETLLSFYNLYFGASLRLNRGGDLSRLEKYLHASICLLAEHYHDRGVQILTDLHLAPLGALRAKQTTQKCFAEGELLQIKYAEMPSVHKELGLRYLALAYFLQEESALLTWNRYLAKNLKRPMVFLDLAEGYFFMILSSLELAYRGVQAEVMKKTASKYRHQFQFWAQRYPLNLEHRLAFLNAEWLAFEGQPLEALQAYEQVLSKTEENLMLTALAAQRAGVWAQRAGLRGAAEKFLQKAHRSFSYWGAEALCRQLEAQYPDMLWKQASVNLEDSSLALNHPHLLQAALLISEETQKETLIEKLLRLTAQTAGAERSVLLLKIQEQWQLAGVFQAQQTLFTPQKGLLLQDRAEALDLPWALLEECIKTQTPRMIRDARSELSELNTGAEEAFRSLLVLPLQHQGQGLGLLYLENNQMTAAFNAHQLSALKVLAAQAAIVFSNLQLYQQLQLRNQVLETEVEKRTEALAQVNRQLEDLNRELEHQNQFLAHVNRVKDEFLNMVSHDLKNPLNNILLFSRFLESRTLTESKTREIGAMISRAGKRMFSLLEDLLDLNRLEQKKLKLNPEPVYWSHEIQKLLKDFQPLALEKQQSLQFIQQTQHDLIQADPVRLRQIMDNLISNALKFSEAERQIRVILEQGQDAEEVVLSVLDQGPGLTASELKQLFQPFVKLSPRPTGGESSSGLGLSIAYQLAEAMQARLSCESQVGVGSTFRLAFSVLRVVSEA